MFTYYIHTDTGNEKVVVKEANSCLHALNLAFGLMRRH
jgi:hypothetical protein